MSSLDTAGQESYLAELQSIANKLALPMAQTDDLVMRVARDILRSMYRYPGFKKSAKGLDEEVPLTDDEKDLNRRIEGVYAEMSEGQSFPSYRRKKIRGSGFVGPPGHGKTSVIEAASRWVATKMEMRLLNPDRLESVPLSEIDMNTFVLVSEETAGLSSAMELYGMPAEGLDEETRERFLGRLFSLPLKKLARAGGGTFLFDDFSNAARHIQDVGLALMDRRRNGELVLLNTYFCITGNLGGLDDTNASRMSSALRGRILTYLVHDTVENFVYRNQSDPLLQDDLGDAFVRSFLKRHGDTYFSKMPEKGQQGGFPSPRTWRDLIDDLRDCIHFHGGREHAEAARMEMRELAKASVGLETALAFDAHLEAVFSGAEPLAQQLVSTGKLDQEKFDKCYAAGGPKASDLYFSIQFALALVDHTIMKIMDEKKLEQAIQRFSKGIELLDEAAFGFALEELQTRLIVQVPEVGKLKIAKIINAQQNRRELSTEAGTVIGELIMESSTVDSARRQLIINTFSDLNKQDERLAPPPSLPSQRQRGP